MSLVYGRFTDTELERQGSNPYVEQGGRRYRITELVNRMEGGANYQAVEVGPDDVAPEPAPDLSLPSRNESLLGFVPEPPPDFVPPAWPPLKTWAKDNGWKGRGPISDFIRKQYREAFGEEAYRQQTT
jgi:hypothetical protein